MNLTLLFVSIFIVLQFTNAITSIALFSNSIASATTLFKFYAGKVGVPAAVITTKVVLVAIVVALYMLTTLPYWVYVAASAVYLYKTGEAAYLWAKIKSAAQTTATTVTMTSESFVQKLEEQADHIIAEVKAHVESMFAAKTVVPAVTTQPVVTPVPTPAPTPAPSPAPDTGAAVTGTTGTVAPTN